VRAKSTRELLKKIAAVPCLYRHEEDGRYYGVKKHKGRILTRALKSQAGESITDRKIAERALREWIDSLSAPRRYEGQLPTLGEVLERFAATKDGKKDKTKRLTLWILSSLQKAWGRSVERPITAIRSSDISTVLASFERRLKPNSFNKISFFLRAAFQMAVHDGYLTPPSPYEGATNRTKKVIREKPCIPTREQLHAILDHIRRTRNHKGKQSADFVHFLALAAIGEAELNLLTWENVDWQRGVMHLRRKKTEKPFDVPIYPHFEPFLTDLWERKKKPTTGRIFAMENSINGLRSACRALNYPRFTPRSLRQYGIVYQLRRGLPTKLVAKYQGHKNDWLIITTYSEVIAENDAAYEREQLAKL
jgi:integrase